jgi:hypothetical protein
MAGYTKIMAPTLKLRRSAARIEVPSLSIIAVTPSKGQGWSASQSSVDPTSTALFKRRASIAAGNRLDEIGKIGGPHPNSHVCVPFLIEIPSLIEIRLPTSDMLVGAGTVLQSRRSRSVPCRCAILFFYDDVATVGAETRRLAGRTQLRGCHLKLRRRRGRRSSTRQELRRAGPTRTVSNDVHGSPALIILCDCPVIGSLGRPLATAQR